MQARRPDNPGKQYNPYGNNPVYVQPTNTAATLNVVAKKKKKKEDDTEKLPRLGDFVSEEIKMMLEPKAPTYSDGPNYDDIEVEKSCLNLEIDG
jgi:hypothetical protein